MTTIMIYGIGDKVVHPYYGAGIVRRLVRRTISGMPRRYYLIEPVALGQSELMIPVDRAGQVGLRKAVRPAAMARALRTLAGSPGKLSTDYKKRQERIRDCLQSRDPERLASAARDLSAFMRSHRGRLSLVDVGLLKKTREFLASELALIHDTTFDDALTRVDDFLAMNSQVSRPSR